MSILLVKTSRVNLKVKDEVHFDEPLRKKVFPKPQDKAFIWTSETAGGRGLAGKGIVKSVNVVGRRVQLTVLIEQVASKTFGNKNLDEPANNAIPGLAKIRSSSNNAVSGLDQETATALDEALS